MKRRNQSGMTLTKLKRGATRRGINVAWLARELIAEGVAIGIKRARPLIPPTYTTHTYAY